MAEDKDESIVTMETKNGDGLKLKKYQDDVVMPFVMLQIVAPDQKMKNIADVEYKDGDIMLCSFVKCGTHWVGNMISKLLGIYDENKPTFKLLEMGSPEDTTSHPSPRILVTHLWAKRLPKEYASNCGKTILLLRNPKDMAVSFFHHLRNAVSMSNKQTWDEYFASFMQGHIPWGSYFDYLNSWNKEMKENTMGLDIELFFYEDFIADCCGQLKRLADFLGVSKSEDGVKKISEECTLANLKERAKPNKGLSDKDGKSVIYRKGCIGDWRNHFTMAQSEQFDAVLREKKVPFEFNYGSPCTS